MSRNRWRNAVSRSVDTILLLWDILFGGCCALANIFSRAPYLPMQATDRATTVINANHKVVSIASIQSRVAEVFRTTKGELLSRRRTAKVACARHVAMYLCRGVARRSVQGLRKGKWASFPRIGMAFERDHSSVIHACKVVARRRNEDTEFARLLEDLERELVSQAVAPVLRSTRN